MTCSARGLLANWLKCDCECGQYTGNAGSSITLTYSFNDATDGVLYVQDCGMAGTHYANGLMFDSVGYCTNI